MYRGEVSSKPRPFGSINSGGYEAFVPSVGYMTNLFIAATQQEREYALLWMLSQGGVMLKTDHHFGTTDFIRLADHSKAFEAILTVMNESCQVLVQFLTSSKSLQEVQAGLERLVEAYTAQDLQVCSCHGCCICMWLDLWCLCVAVTVAMQHVPSCDWQQWYTNESYRY
jgi:hypothetical protein